VLQARAFSAVQAAWEALRDPQRRADYDAALQHAAAAARSAFAHSQHVSAHIGDDDLDWDAGAGQPFFTCRCGDRIYVADGGGEDGEASATAACSTPAAATPPAAATAVVSCPSCSLRYRLETAPHR
jgi:DnaJ-class molecular chaperone